LPDLAWTAADGRRLQADRACSSRGCTQGAGAALKQNITTLHNRVNELGVAEPVIQQQGLTGWSCSCPACRTPPRPRTSSAAPPRWKCAWSTTAPRRAAALSGSGPVPFGTERYLERNGQPVIVKKQVILTGENLTDAQPGFDSQTRSPPCT
jgi:preprotein translocase subunit SecD